MSTWGARAASSDSDSEAICQQRFTQLADMSSDRICVHQDGRIVFANAAAIRWMGVDWDGCPAIMTTFRDLTAANIDRPGIDRLVDALHRAAAKPIRYRGLDILVTASMGVTVVEPDDARDALDLLRAADEAMYAATTSGRGLTGYAR